MLQAQRKKAIMQRLGTYSNAQPSWQQVAEVHAALPDLDFMMASPPAGFSLVSNIQNPISKPRPMTQISITTKSTTNSLSNVILSRKKRQGKK
jgi:hypothetical protein